VLCLFQLDLPGWWLCLEPLPRPRFFLPSAVRPRASRCLWTGLTIQLMRASRRMALCWGLSGHAKHDEGEVWEYGGREGGDGGGQCNEGTASQREANDAAVIGRGVGYGEGHPSAQKRQCGLEWTHSTRMTS
jgi:hypothetical protein